VIRRSPAPARAMATSRATPDRPKEIDASRNSGIFHLEAPMRGAQHAAAERRVRLDRAGHDVSVVALVACGCPPGRVERSSLPTWVFVHDPDSSRAPGRAKRSAQRRPAGARLVGAQRATPTARSGSSLRPRDAAGAFAAGAAHGIGRGRCRSVGLDGPGDVGGARYARAAANDRASCSRQRQRGLWKSVTGASAPTPGTLWTRLSGARRRHDRDRPDRRDVMYIGTGEGTPTSGRTAAT